METSAQKNSISHALASQSIGKLLVQYSLPAIVASLATSLYNIVDSVFIGRGVDAMAITGLAISFPLMNLVVAFVVLIGSGGSTVSSIFMGQKRLDKANNVLGNVTILALVHSVATVLLGLVFLEPILYFFGATEETVGYAYQFMQIIMLGAPVSYIFLTLNNIMRATGYPRKAMISALLSVGVNVALAPLFIFVFHWGMRGAACATIISQGCAFIWVLIHFINPNSTVHFTRKCWKLDGKLIKKMYAIGLSPFLMNCTACLVVVFINRALLESAGDEGNLAVGAYGIINRTSMFFVMIIFGVTQGMQPILGFNYGAANWQRVRSTLVRGIVIATAVSCSGFIITEFFPDSISAMFTTDSEMIRIAGEGFKIFFLAFPVIGSQIVIQNYFQSLGKPKLSIFLSLTRQLIFLLPLLRVLPPRMGVTGVWTATCCSDFLAFALALITVIIMNRRIRHQLDIMCHDQNS